MNTKKERIYMCIDLKSFYASAECADMGLDPFTTNLVVADPSRGPGAICLAITPAMKELGVKNRCRLNEIPPSVEYVTALPRMKLYMHVSAQIYGIYLRYIAPEDIHVYSVDEVFIDASPYLRLYGKTPKELAVMLMDEVFAETHITATAGIGTNMFLAKVALDITAKHVPDHIGILDEEEFRRTVWYHQPLTDIWGIGGGTARRLEKYGARCLHDITTLPEKLLYKNFGVNARYLIDHAYGREDCTIAEIQGYETKTKSLSNSQVLFRDYGRREALTVLKEMIDGLVTEMIAAGLYTDHVSVFVGYSGWHSAGTGGSRKLAGGHTDSYRTIEAEIEGIYERTTRYHEPIRRLGISFGNLTNEPFHNLSFFEDFEKAEREHSILKAVSVIKERFGKNAILRGISYQREATARVRNTLVGGHNG